MIDGHKWFSSGAEGAAFGASWPSPTPTPIRTGVRPRSSSLRARPASRSRRAIPTMGHRGRGWTTHCEVRYSGVRVPVENTLGEEGDGLPNRAEAARPGRIHHVMRWLGQMQRAFELMCTYALERESFGGPLADKQTVQNWIADSAAEIQACRLMTLDAAHKIDLGDEARVEVLGDQVLRGTRPARGDRPRGAGPRCAWPDRRDAARRGCSRWRAAPGSTTGPTRCTAWSSHGGFSSRSPPASRGASTNRPRGGRRPGGLRRSRGDIRQSQRLGSDRRRAAVGPGPRIAAAGDIACDPGDSKFDGGQEAATTAANWLRPTCSSARAMPQCSCSVTSSTRTARTPNSSLRTIRRGGG